MTDKPTDAEKRDLDIVAQFASEPVRHVLESAFVRFAAQAFFTSGGHVRYSCSPANTMPYLALTALENQSVIYLSEVLKEEKKRRSVSAVLDKKALLPLHRDMLGHPMTFEWRHSSRKDFAPRGHHSYYRSGLVWTVAKAFDAALETNGIARHLAVVPSHLGMAEMLHSIFRLSMRDESDCPSAAELLAYFQRQGGAFVELLERFPDGLEPQEETPEGSYDWR
jgi:hypothetical protein